MNLEESMYTETHQEASSISVHLAARSLTRRSGICERETYDETNFERPMTLGTPEINGITN